MSITLGAHSYHGQVTNSWDVSLHVGKYTSIASGLLLIANDHPMGMNVSTYPFFEQFHLDYTPCTQGGIISIGHDVWIGILVSIKEGVTIGDGAIVGACSVVARNIDPYEIVVGNPIREIRHRFPFQIIHALLKMKWWDWPDDVVRERVPEMKDVFKFVEKYGGR